MLNIGCIHALKGTASSFSCSKFTYFYNLNTAWECHNSFNLHIFPLCLSRFIQYFPSISSMLLNNLTEFATNAIVPGISESLVLADQSASNPPVHSSTSRGGNLFPPFRCISCRYKPVRHREAAAMEWHLTIRELDLQNNPLLSDLYLALSCYPSLSTAWDILSSHTATREQAINEQLWRLDIDRVRFVSNNRRARSAFVTNQQGLS